MDPLSIYVRPKYDTQLLFLNSNLICVLIILLIEWLNDFFFSVNVYKNRPLSLWTGERESDSCLNAVENECVDECTILYRSVCKIVCETLPSDTWGSVSTWCWFFLHCNY